MNYQHAFHAGNFADVVKHIVLVRILSYLQEKPAAFRVIDSHAGAGVAVDHPERRGLLLQVTENAYQHDVLDDIGEVSGVEGVLIIHPPSPSRRRRKPHRQFDPWQVKNDIRHAEMHENLAFLLPNLTHNRRSSLGNELRSAIDRPLCVIAFLACLPARCSM